DLFNLIGCLLEPATVSVINIFANAVLCGTGKISSLGAIICFYEPVAYLGK
ncbi:hypothetical protein BHM03_00060739, partial [Ensete ventricosum]